MARHTLRRDSLVRLPLRLIGVDAERSYVEVDEREVHVVFGRADERIPLAAIRRAAATEWPLYYGLGVRVGAGSIAYVGSTRGCVRLDLAEPRPFRVILKVTARFGACTLALEEPEAFLADLGAHGVEA